MKHSVSSWQKVMPLLELVLGDFSLPDICSKNNDHRMIEFSILGEIWEQVSKTWTSGGVLWTVYDIGSESL